MTTATTNPLPPPVLDTPSAWLGKDMAAAPERWLVHLTESQIAELESAATRFLDSGKEIGEMVGDEADERGVHCGCVRFLMREEYRLESRRGNTNGADLTHEPGSLCLGRYHDSLARARSSAG